MKTTEYPKDIGNSLISIIVTTYYRNEGLDLSLESIENIEYSPIEIIVVDASGTSHAKPVVDSYCVDQYISLDKDPGIARTRQEGVEVSSGDYIKFLDDGDQLISSSVGNLLTDITSTDAKVAYGGFRLVNGRRMLPRSDVEGDVLEFALAMDMGPVVPSTMLVSKPAIESILPLDYPDGADDNAMQIELARRYNYTQVNRIVVIMAESQTSLSNSWCHVNSHQWVMDRFSSLYQKSDPWIERSVKAQFHRKAAAQLSRERLWTPQMTLELLKAARYDKNKRVKYAAMAVASVFGNIGLRFGEKVYKFLWDII